VMRSCSAVASFQMSALVGRKFLIAASAVARAATSESSASPDSNVHAGLHFRSRDSLVIGSQSRECERLRFGAQTWACNPVSAVSCNPVATRRGERRRVASPHRVRVAADQREGGRRCNRGSPRASDGSTLNPSVVTKRTGAEQIRIWSYEPPVGITIVRQGASPANRADRRQSRFHPQPENRRTIR